MRFNTFEPRFSYIDNNIDTNRTKTQLTYINIFKLKKS